MRVPYVVGRWVRGNNHYGRQRAIEYLLGMKDDAIWVVGTRRIGKTSLLRQVELLTASDPLFVPLFWDMQGCETPQQLSEELLYALEDVLDRFAPYGIELDALIGQDAIGILRKINRALGLRGRRLLLLIDEAEALIAIGERDGNWLARLRKAFQHSEQRTILTATKLLSKLNDLSTTWTTSPFLFGFRMVNLWSLDNESAEALIRQLQSSAAIQVDETTVQDIVLFTNRHPYLMQYLCQNLFEPGENESGSLRPVEEADLNPDQLLAGFFHIDFQHLSRLERQLLLLITELSVVPDEDLFAHLPAQDPDRIQRFLYGLEKLGTVRRVGRHWTVGNEYFRRWLREHLVELSQDAPAIVSDSRVEELAHEGVGQEFSYLQQRVAQLQQTLAAIDARRHDADDADALDKLQEEIVRTRQQLDEAQRSLESLVDRFPIDDQPVDGLLPVAASQHF